MNNTEELSVSGEKSSYLVVVRFVLFFFFFWCRMGRREVFVFIFFFTLFPFYCESLVLRWHKSEQEADPTASRCFHP